MKFLHLIFMFIRKIKKIYNYSKEQFNLIHKMKWIGTNG
jgi:hypothetical protein